MKTITVTGTGRASAAPDLITIFMTVNAEDTDYRTTMELAARHLEALREAVSAAGFDREALKTASFSVDTRYEHEHTAAGKYERRFAGYCCEHRLTLQFDLDMERLSAVIAALSGCSCSPEFSLRFGVKDEAAFKEEMLRSAAANAAVSARTLASAAGVSLGELVSINYSWGNIVIESETEVTMMRAAGPTVDAAMDFTPEDITRTDTATFVWEIS